MDILAAYEHKLNKDTGYYHVCQCESDAMDSAHSDAAKRLYEAYEMAPKKFLLADREFCWATLMEKGACLDDGQFYERLQERRDWHFKKLIGELDILADGLFAKGGSEAADYMYQIARELQLQNEEMGTPEEARKKWMTDGRSRDCGEATDEMKGLECAIESTPPIRLPTHHHPEL